MGIFSHILVPLDGSRLAECVLPHLLALTDSSTRVSLLRVLENTSETGIEQPVDPLDWRISHSEAQAYLEQIAESLRSTHLQNIEYAVLEGMTAERVIEYGQKNDGELILLSSHGKTGINRWNVSGIVRKIVQRAPRSTMIVRAYNFEGSGLVPVQYRHLLIPLDGSFRAELSLPQAVMLAQQHNAKLTLAHVINRPELIQRVPLTPDDQELMTRLLNRAQEIADKYMDQLRSRVPIDFESEIRISSDVTHTIQRIVDERGVDLVFVSAHGHSADPTRYYGNVAGGLIEFGSMTLITIQDISQDEFLPTRAEEAAREQKGHA